MEKDIKREALRRYLKYFKVWFIIAGILAVVTIRGGGCSRSACYTEDCPGQQPGSHRACV